jgi:hypothetical protein
VGLNIAPKTADIGIQLSGALIATGKDSSTLWRNLQEISTVSQIQSHVVDTQQNLRRCLLQWLAFKSDRGVYQSAREAVCLLNTAMLQISPQSGESFVFTTTVINQYLLERLAPLSVLLHDK